MTRFQLISKVSRQTGLAQAETVKVFDAFVNNIIDSLRDGEKVTIAGFGRFEMRQRKTKAYTNPKTHQKSQLQPAAIPASRQAAG